MNTRNKNSKKLVIGIVMFILILTGAYALFSTSINIFGTVNATADFEVVFTSALSTDTNKAAVVLDEAKKKMTISADLTAPGEEVTINYVIKNIGTLSATVDDVTIENNSNLDLIVKINNLDDMQGTVLATGQEKSGSINIKWDINSTNENPDPATFSVTIDYSQTID